MRNAFILSVAFLAIMPPSVALGAGTEEARLRQVAFDYAKCVVRKSHAKASEAVLATVSDDAIKANFLLLVDSDCLVKSADVGEGGIQFRFPEGTLQGVLADALVNADFSTQGDASFEDRLPLIQPFVPTAEQEAGELAKARNDRKREEIRSKFLNQRVRAWMSIYGECVVRHDPEGTRSWLLTPPDTAEEASRIKALQPAMGDCLREGTIKFTRPTLRGTVAINYYRLAMATRVPGAGGKK